METVPEPESKKNQLMTKLRKLLVVLGAALVVLGLLLAGLGRAHLSLGRLRSIRKYAHLPKRRQRLQIEGKVPEPERK
jgi:hypothetical protein